MIYQISSGQGPAECELGVAKFLEYLQKNHNAILLDYSPGYYADTYRSVAIYSDDDLNEYIGSVQWVCKSVYRPGHKRKNWFLDFSEVRVFADTVFDEKQIIFEPIHCGGKGGQHVNKAETGIRAVYVPCMISAVCTEERSQLQNKKNAVEKLRRAITSSNRQRKAKEVNDKWLRHTRLVRGCASRKFFGIDFTLCNE